jgi:hypothetical protein
MVTIRILRIRIARRWWIAMGVLSARRWVVSRLFTHWRSPWLSLFAPAITTVWRAMII